MNTGKDTSVRIGKDTHDQAKKRAQENGQTVKGYITKLIEKDLSQQQRPQQKQNG